MGHGAISNESDFVPNKVHHKNGSGGIKSVGGVTKCACCHHKNGSGGIKSVGGVAKCACCHHKNGSGDIKSVGGVAKCACCCQAPFPYQFLDMPLNNS